MSSYVNFVLRAKRKKFQLKTIFYYKMMKKKLFFVDENSFVFPIVEDLFSDKRDEKKVYAISFDKQ